jgi:transposase
MSLAESFAGIDISKFHLDIHVLPEGRTWRVAHTAEAVEALALELKRLRARRIVFEATGGYERPLRRIFAKHELACSQINPRQARRFAQSRGILAKTDRIDARVLAEYGRLFEPAPTPAPSPEQERLDALLTRRAQLVEMRKQERTRLKQAADESIVPDIEQHAEYLTRMIRKIEEEIRALIRAVPAFKTAFERLLSAPGVGFVSAALLLARMPELGHLSRHGIAALAGLAPHPCDSGAMRGKRMIWGGRKSIRDALFMAATAAARSSACFKTVYNALRERGKAHKVAIIAIARRLLVTLNAMMRDKVPFSCQNT